MGLMRFRVYPAERITDEMLQQAYLSGLDGVSWPVRISAGGGELMLHRAVSDSANLHVPWPVEGAGPMTFTTASLLERPEPYCLPLELARGMIVKVRNQLSEWELIGLTVPASVPARIAEAVGRLSWSVVTQDDAAVSADHAEAALRAAVEAGNILAAAYTEQALAVRRRNGGKAGCLLGADLGPALLDNYMARQFLQTFGLAKVPFCWRDLETTEGNYSWSIPDRQIEWCRANGLKVIAGPLLTFDVHSLPDWLYLFDDDFDSVMDFATAFVQAAVEQFRGRVDYWVCAGRFNASEALSLTEQAKLRLVARSVELVRSLDPDTPALVAIDQPWAEYLRHRESDFLPLQIADALVRSDLGLAGLMLELNIGYWPGGSLPRHLLDFSRLLDSWSLLGLPLWLAITVPSAYHNDPLARCKTHLPPGSWTTTTQQAWVARFVPMALAKAMVQGVIWNQLCDCQPHEFAHGGLFDERRQAKLSLRTWNAIRQTYLK